MNTRPISLPHWLTDMNWTAFDFIFAFVLLGSVVLIFTLVMRKTDNTAFRSATGVALAAAFMLVWANGAVGIIGDENNDANMMYSGVLLVAIIGAIIARFRPQGLARAMYATAIAQVLVPVIALIAGLGPVASWDVLVLTAFFGVLWFISARLFQHSARSGNDR
jgi:hypothetical protein